MQENKTKGVTEYTWEKQGENTLKPTTKFKVFNKPRQDKKKKLD